MPTLTCDISESLMQALAARSTRTGEPLAHIVRSALADVLEVEHSTLFQVSTSTALVQGVYDGVVHRRTEATRRLRPRHVRRPGR